MLERGPALLLFVTAALTAAGEAYAQAMRQGVGAYVTLTSDYRNRGLSQSHGEPSLQLGVDYQHRSGFFAGAWAADVEYSAETRIETNREIEIDYYAGYDWRRSDWSLAVTLGRYTYPGSAFDYDYNELSGSVGYRGRVFFTASYTDDLYSRGLSTLNTELSVALPLAWNMELGATLGRVSSDLLRAGRYTHWNIGVTKLVAQIGLDLRYYGTSYEGYSPLGSPAEDRWVLSASYGFGAR